MSKPLYLAGRVARDVEPVLLGPFSHAAVDAGVVEIVWCPLVPAAATWGACMGCRVGRAGRSAGRAPGGEREKGGKRKRRRPYTSDIDARYGEMVHAAVSFTVSSTTSGRGAGGVGGGGGGGGGPGGGPGGTGGVGGVGAGATQMEELHEWAGPPWWAQSPFWRWLAAARS